MSDVDPVHEEACTVAADEGRVTRASFVRRGLVIAGASVGGLEAASWLGDGRASASTAQDLRIFNFALLLEYLQSSFYDEALVHGKLRGDLRAFATVVARHEREHVRFLRDALGKGARAAPRFHFGNATRDPATFAVTAAKLEDLGVSAYNGQAANLTKPALAAAAKIVSVDARHAGWIRAIRAEDPAPHATDKALTAREVEAALKKTGFM